MHDDDERPTHLDLFSGIGGFALAARWAGFRTIGFCECEAHCQKTIIKNFGAEIVPDDSINGRRSRRAWRSDSSGARESKQTLPIFGNIRTLDGTQFRRNGCNVTLLTGGFPCQPFSCAGKRRGKADDRHLWPEMLRVITEARPAWVLGENVAGIIGMELDAVLSDLETIGYAARPFVIPACGVDAKHRRNRVWIVGARRTAGKGDVADGNGRRWQARNGNISPSGHWNPAAASGGNVSDAGEPRLEGQRQIACGIGTQLDDTGDACRWQPEPDVGRVAHGIPARVDRLRGLGNAIVPQVAFQILKAIREEIRKHRTLNTEHPTPNEEEGKTRVAGGRTRKTAAGMVRSGSKLDAIDPLAGQEELNFTEPATPRFMAEFESRKLRRAAG